MPTDAEIRVYKTAFAEALLRYPEDPDKAAFSAIPDTGTALQAARLWASDPFVLAEKKRLIEEYGEKQFIPGKDAQCRAVWDLANDRAVDPKERIAAHRLYAELNSFIEKPSTNINVPILNQSVMVIKDMGSDADWERRAVQQQNRLILDAPVN